MEDKPQVKEEQTPQAETKLEQDTPQKPKPKISQKKLLVIIVIICILIIVLLILALACLLLGKRGKGDTETAEKETGNGAEEQQEEDDTGAEDKNGTEEGDGDGEGDDDGTTEEAPQNRVAYIKNHNIWIVNNDGTGKKKLTSDGSSTVKYDTLAWRSDGVLNYSKCSDQCRVYMRDIATDTETLLLTGIPFTQSFDALKWSHDEKKLVYIFTKGDYSREAVLRTFSGGLDITVPLHSYAPYFGTVAHFDKGMYIEFSPNDQRIVVFNTFVNTAIDNNIMAFNNIGAYLFEIEDVFPTFDGNDGFYYKYKFGAFDKLYRWNFITDSSSQVASFSMDKSHELQTSPDRNFVAYWDEVGASNTALYYYDTTGSPSKIADDLVSPKWLGNDSVYLIAIKAPTIASPGGYASEGIVRVKREDGATVTLDTGAIYEFDVE